MSQKSVSVNLRAAMAFYIGLGLTRARANIAIRMPLELFVLEDGSTCHLQNKLHFVEGTQTSV
jgi:hypothetical protein